MLTEFIRYLSAERRYSPLTVRNYKHDVEQFLAWLDCDESRFDPRSVTTEQIREWIIFRTEEGRIIICRNEYISMIQNGGRMMNTDRLPEVNNLPNDETIAAMKEVDEMRKHPEQYPAFTSVYGMLDALLKNEGSDGVRSDR